MPTPGTLLLPDDPGADLYRVRAGAGKSERVLFGSELIAGIVVAETAMLKSQQRVCNRTGSGRRGRADPIFPHCAEL